MRVYCKGRILQFVKERSDGSNGKMRMEEIILDVHRKQKHRWGGNRSIPIINLTGSLVIMVSKSLPAILLARFGF